MRMPRCRRCRSNKSQDSGGAVRSIGFDLLTLCLCGDVMTGRGVDQILPHGGTPVLYENCIRDAREYVRLAESASGPIRYPVNFEYIWGDALKLMHGADVRIVNLETAITSCSDPWPGKSIHYRMHPRNIGCLTAARIDCCCLANNHVLDWGYGGLAETLATLEKAHFAHAGAGLHVEAAAAAAVIELTGGRRVLVASLASEASGVPGAWAATTDRASVNLLSNLSPRTAEQVAHNLCRTKCPGDVAVASIHWGSNWGYDIPCAQRDFAHRLIDCGVDIVHGHSSHHAKAIEIYRDRLILYGCGDFINDYEGIPGYEEYHGELRLMYLPQVDPTDGRLVQARLIPLRSRRLRLERAAKADVAWLCQLLSREGAACGTSLRTNDDSSLSLQWQ